MKTKIMKENKNSDTEDGLLRFCTLMIKLYSCCAISAGIVRIFSVFGLIWTKLRKNRENGPNLPRPQQKFDLNL
jgi:hypothetical protein